VSAAVERRDLVALLPSRGEHDHRHGRPLAKLLQYLQAVDVGEAQVENDEVRLPGRGLDEPVAAGGRLEDPIVVSRQRCPKKAPNLRLVLHEHDGPAPYASVLCSRPRRPRGSEGRPPPPPHPGARPPTAA